MNLPGPVWTAGEAATVNEFLNTPVGKKWLGVLLNLKPRIDVTSTEKAALTGAEAAGYDRFFDQITATRSTLRSEDMSTKGIDPTRD